MTSPAPANLAAGLLDDINKAIVEQLQQDGRRTYGSIAEAKNAAKRLAAREHLPTYLIRLPPPAP